MTYTPECDRDDPTQTIADLCRPLSAKDMPRSAYTDMQGNPKSPGRVLLAQRTSASNQRAAKRRFANAEVE